MDHAAYHVVYVDSRASDDLDGKYIQKSRLKPREGGELGAKDPRQHRTMEYVEMIFPLIEEVRNNIKSILSIFGGVYLCTSGNTCIAKLAELESTETNVQPTLVILEAPADYEIEDDGVKQLPQFPLSSLRFHKRQGLPAFLAQTESSYGLSLLQRICAEISTAKLSKLVVPIAMVPALDAGVNGTHGDHQLLSSRPQRLSSGGIHKVPAFASSNGAEASDRSAIMNPRQVLQCLEAGAVDVLGSPLRRDRLSGLVTHGYRAQKEAFKDRAALLATTRLRKRSWVGFDDKKPFAYLREEMVSNLMTRICNPDHVQQDFDQSTLCIPPLEREHDLVQAIGSWGFCAHKFNDDELLHAAFLMLQHALTMPELDSWRLPADDLKTFLMASRAAYNDFVHYHNFRHVVDVLQAVFFFVVQLGTLPPFPASSIPPDASKHPSPVAALLRPFDALTLLISAIGHDVGHPGVNNAFLVVLKAPLAQLYNDKSVLESFHCAAYSQILRRHWKHAFEDIAMRGLLISSILATDMGLHFKYMSDLGNFQDKVHHNRGTEGWSPQVLDEYRTLTCGLLIKCADISNVARPFDVAAEWSDLLQREFSNQGIMEKEVNIPTTLFGGPPDLDDSTKLANSQIGFMNIFARPLFEAVTDVLPAMVFAVDEMKENQGLWKRKIDKASASRGPRKPKKKYSSEDFLSPRSGSPNPAAIQPELSHPEGLPASHSLSLVPTLQSISQNFDTLRESRRGSAGSITHLIGVPESSSPYQSPNMSRRSSLGLPLGYGSPRHDSTSFSRRSSGAFPGANLSSPNLTRRRSNNSLPSQLQLGLGPEPVMHASPVVPSNENVQPLERASEDTLSGTRSGDLSLHDREILPVGGGGDTNHHRVSKGGDSDHIPSHHHSPNSGHQSTRHTHVSGTGPISVNSSRNRNSSGAHTSLTQSMPYSPTGTLATSFLTVDSDEKSFHGGGEDRCSPAARRMPDVVDAERPGSGHKRLSKPGREEHMSTGGRDVVSTSVANGGVSTGHGAGDRVLTRKGSRFRLDFWRKR